MSIKRKRMSSYLRDLYVTHAVRMSIIGMKKVKGKLKATSSIKLIFPKFMTVGGYTYSSFMRAGSTKRLKKSLDGILDAYKNATPDTPVILFDSYSADFIGDPKQLPPVMQPITKYSTLPVGAKIIRR